MLVAVEENYHINDYMVKKLININLLLLEQLLELNN